jgi:hypothetical protein
LDGSLELEPEVAVSSPRIERKKHQCSFCKVVFTTRPKLIKHACTVPSK